MRETTQSEYQKAVNRVIDYIDQHLYEMPDIRTLGEVANISGFHFHRIFKVIIGENIGEYILRLRMEDIALRLLMSDDTLENIAYTTGYASKQALSRAFRKHHSVSPSHYRKQAKNLHPFFGDEEREYIAFHPESRIIASKEIVYIRIIDIYGAEQSYGEAWRKIGKYAAGNNLIDSSTEFIGLSFDDPAITSPSQCRFYAAFTPCREVVPEGEFGVRTIRGGRYLVFTHRGPYHKLKDAYYNIYVRWLPQNNIRIKGSMSFEKYLNSPSVVDEKDLLTEIYVPI